MDWKKDDWFCLELVLCLVAIHTLHLQGDDKNVVCNRQIIGKFAFFEKSLYWRLKEISDLVGEQEIKTE
jgi:hypothetical protein